MKKLMEPPKGKPTAKAVFWFLAWHKVKYGEAFSFEHQTQLAAAVGVSDRAISDLVHNPPEWFVFTGRSADITEPVEESLNVWPSIDT